MVQYSEKKGDILMLKLKRQMLSLALALSMVASTTGCGKKDDIKTLTEKSVAAKAEKLPDGTLYIKEFELEGHLYVMAYSNDEIRQYLSMPYPTFKDVRETIQNNKNLTDIVKILILTYVDKLENKKPDIDLAVFNYNMELLNFEQSLDAPDTSEKQAHVAAEFKPDTHTLCLYDSIQINNNSWIYSFYHELSHALDTTIVEKENKTISRKNYLNITNEQGILEEFGYNLYEGYTDFYTHEICDYIHIPYEINESSYLIGGYYEYSDIFSLFNDCIDKDTTYFQEYGMVEFIDNLLEKGIKNPVSLINKVDSIVSIPNEDESIRETIYSEIFRDKTEYWLNKDYSNGQIYELAENLFNETFMEKHILANDPIIKAFWGNTNQRIKLKVNETIENVLSEKGSSFDGENKESSSNNNMTTPSIYNYTAQVSLDNAFFYEDFQNQIHWCYQLKVEDNLILYYDKQTNSFIDESTMLYGELLSILEEKEIVTFSQDKQGEIHVKVDPTAWQNYFGEQKGKVFQYR